MSNLILEFEARVGLGVRQSVILLDIAAPTYYQYRRTGVMPDHFRRCLQIIMDLEPVTIDGLIRTYVNEVDDDTL